MYKKSIALALCAAVAVLSLTGCGSVERIANSADTITIDRGEYLALKNGMVTAQDISSVIAFMGALETTVDGLGEYTTSYDAETNTVYVITEKGNIAFRLDDDGNVLFAAANGTGGNKAELSQGILETQIANVVANRVRGVFDEVEQTKWLNTINANVIAAEIGAAQFTALDTSLMYFSTPALDRLATTDYERDILETGKLTMPVLTEHLDSYGITDLSNYYEAPSLVKFWPDMDMSNMESKIDEMVSNGVALSEQFSNIELEAPSTAIPEWTLSSYSLPSTFSDGSSTSLGAETLSAYNSFYGSLSAWRDALVQDELNAQNNAITALNQANTFGNESVQKQVEANNAMLSSLSSSYRQSSANRTQSAFGNVGAAGSQSQGSVSGFYANGQAQTQSQTEAEHDKNEEVRDAFVEIVQGAHEGEGESTEDLAEKAQEAYDAIAENRAVLDMVKEKTAAATPSLMPITQPGVTPCA